MTMMTPVLSAVLFSLLRLAAAESVTLTLAPDFPSQRPCAQGCFGGGIYVGAGELAYEIGCEYRNPQNECVCRLDLQDSADAYIRSCVDRECTRNSLDTNSAVSIYDAYCTSAGFIRSTPARTTDSPTSSSSSKSQPQQTSPTTHTFQTSLLVSSNSAEDSISRTSSGETQSPAATDPVSSSSSNGDGNKGNSEGGNNTGSNNGLGTGDIIGIVIGVLGFIATAIGTWFTYQSKKNKKRPVP